SYQRLEADVEQRRQQLEEAERRYEAATHQARELDLQVLNTTALLSELYLVAEQHAEQARMQLDAKQALRSRRRSFLERETAIRQQRTELSDRQHQLEMQARDMRHQLTTLAERIEEEYQMSL